MPSAQIRNRRWRLPRLARTLALASFLGASAASGGVIGQPVGGDPELSLDDPTLAKLSEGTGAYSVRFTGFDASQFRNAQGGILGVSAEVTFHRVGGGELLPSSGDGGNGDGSSETSEHLLVFTSVRLGTPPPGPLQCPSSTALGLADADFLFGTFNSAVMVRDPDGSGNVCHSEGDVFVAVPLDGDEDTAQQINFQIQLNAPLPSLAFFFQYQAYSVTPVPEPAAAALVLAGVGALAYLRRKRLG